MEGHEVEVAKVDPMAAKELEPICHVAIDSCGAAELTAQSIQHETRVDGSRSQGADVNLIGMGALVDSPRPLDYRIQLDGELANWDGYKLAGDEAHLRNGRCFTLGNAIREFGHYDLTLDARK